jgi:outer membrane protein assembly factor BamB
VLSNGSLPRILENNVSHPPAWSHFGFDEVPMKKGLLAVVIGMAIASSVLADDWPQFRGPDRGGVSKEKGLLKEWPKKGPELVWTFPNAGLGCSSVAVVKGVVYTLGTDFNIKMPNDSPKDGYFAAKDEYVIAIDEKKGTELWRHKIGKVYAYEGKGYGDGPRSTPTIDGNFLYALGGQGQLVCIDLTRAKDKEVWSKNLVTDLGGIMLKYGFSESPLIDGDLLICTPGGPKGTLAALKKKTGEVAWRSEGLTNVAPYSSIVAADFHGVRQYVQTSYKAIGDIHGDVSGFDAKTGKPLWTKKIFDNDNEGIGASPIVTGSQVYVTVGFGGGCHLFAIDNKQNAVEQYKKPMWKNVKNTHGGVVLIDGHVYGHSERWGWICQNLKSGELEWQDDQKLNCTSGAITAAEGNLYLYTEDGEVGLVDADPKAFNLVSSFEIPVKSTIPKVRISSQKARAWAYPVIANGRLYLRDHEYIFAFKITK